MAMIGRNSGVAEMGEHRDELKGTLAVAAWCVPHPLRCTFDIDTDRRELSASAAPLPLRVSALLVPGTIQHLLRTEKPWLKSFLTPPQRGLRQGRHPAQIDSLLSG